MLDQLIEITLLGTERKNLDISLFPQEIRKILEESGEKNMESLLLQAMVLSTFYLDAGINTKEFTGKTEDSIITEVDAIAPQRLLDLFDPLLEFKNPLKTALLQNWLDVLINNNYIVDAELIIKLIQLGKNLSAEIRNQISKVIGNKGRNILSLVPEFVTESVISDEQIWQEGDLSERKILFANLLEDKPDEALKMLSSTWQQEAIIAKKAFLSLIQSNPNHVFLSFVSNLYQVEFAYKAKEKKTEIECRKILSGILLQFPESRLHKETLSGLSNYIIGTKKKRLLGIIGDAMQCEIILPETEVDKFWNKNNMLEIYGIETQNYDIAKFHNIIQYWFSCFLEVLPINELTTYLNLTKVNFLNELFQNKAFIIKSGAEQAPVFLDAILQNIKLLKDNLLAKLVANSAPFQVSVNILKYMTKEDFEGYVFENKYFLNMEVLRNYPFDSENENWSLHFSKYILSSLFDSIQNVSTNIPYNFGAEIAIFLHPDVISDLQKFYSKAINEPFRNVWMEVVHEPLIKTLAIKIELTNYKKVIK